MAFSVSFVFKAVDKYSDVLKKVASATKKLKTEFQKLEACIDKSKASFGNFDTQQGKLLNKLRASAKATGTYTASMKQATQATKAQAQAMKSVGQLNMRIPAMPRLPGIPSARPGRPAAPFTFGKMPEYKTMVRGFNNLGRSVRDVGHETNMLIQRFGALAVAGVGVFGAFIKPAADMELLRRRLDSLYKSADKGKEMFHWVQEFALKSPYSFEMIGDSLAKLKQFGFDNMPEFKNVMNYMATFVPEGSRASRAITQLAQAWGKGTLQMQDIRPMIEDGVDVMGLLSKVTGKTTAQVQEMISKKLIDQKLMLKMMDQMGKAAKPISGSRSIDELWSTITSNLLDVWDKFASNVMESKVGNGMTLFASIKKDVVDLTNTMREGIENGAIQKTARALYEVYVFGRQAFRFLITNIPRAIGLFERFSDAVGGTQNAFRLLIGAITVPWVLSIANMAMQFGINAKNVWNFARGLGMSKAAMDLILGIATKLFGGPWGWVLAAFTALAGIALVLYNNWKPFRDMMDGFGDAISSLGESFMGNLRRGIEAASDALGRLKINLRDVMDLIPGGGLLYDFINANGTSIGNAAHNFAKENRNRGRAADQEYNRNRIKDRMRGAGDPIPAPGLNRGIASVPGHAAISIEIKDKGNNVDKAKINRSSGVNVALNTGRQMMTAPA